MRWSDGRPGGRGGGGDHGRDGPDEHRRAVRCGHCLAQLRARLPAQHQTAAGDAMSTPEPAIKSYFFGKGYTDLAATIAESWERNLASAREHFARASRLTSTDKGEKALAIIQATAGI